ncbi:MAG: hypothetical protein FWH22_10155, partial [Fibromonadales bacterium]|nr:hypothetical protein [Fibromonadales bacterium]
AEINNNCNSSMSREEAIKAAIKTCMGKNILLYFLEKHSSEIENMLLTEWNWDDALAVAREEEREKALKEGREELLTLLRQGYTLHEIEQKLGLL